MGIADRIALYLDGANLEDCRRYASQVQGFTTNPTLMRAAGITDYAAFVPQMLEIADGKPVSFEVIADESDEMALQARWLSSQGPNVFVKIPITTSTVASCVPLIHDLSKEGIPVNVTAVMTMFHVEQACLALTSTSLVSIFAGRIADTGRNPLAYIRCAQKAARACTSLLWASPREVWNVYEAEASGCDIITCTPALIDKLALEDKDLAQYSLETVQMFRRDALAANLTIPSSIRV